MSENTHAYDYHHLLDNNLNELNEKINRIENGLFHLLEMKQDVFIFNKLNEWFANGVLFIVLIID